ncbi:unnamed protein product [Clonostachys rosea]|uniref:DNA polymerase delta subunit 3 n=1 Tax=Bionectria ochroleuca TaxID=29856 RepID=A0ABY6TNM2_BIOOC|nr:unnamed protein product [Clonostachys rosea]
MDEYKKFLADRLLSDEQPITYRLLSRALGIHVNTAKEMLYDYHTYQNGIKAESIHATYVVYGTKTQSSTAGDGDVEMSSSMPEHEPLSETVPTTTLTLVRQENLEAALAEYQEVVSIHVYSLAPGPQRDVSLLYDVAKSLSEFSSKEDPLTAGEKYGTIRNLNVRRRDRQARPKPGSSTSQPTKAQPAKAQPAKAQPVVPIKAEPAASKKPSPFEVAAAAAKLKKQPSSQTPPSSETPASSAGKPAPALKRGGSGGIMQSFAKTKPPKPKPEPKKEEDTEMALSDDGEADDEDIAKEKAEYKDSDAVRKSRKQREEELRRMMEEDDEEEKSEEDPADEEMEEAPEPEPEPEEEPKAKEEEKEPTEITTTSNGRRRGRRKVMKKERVMDEQGYLVTIQKPGWESFSEDEAPPPKKPATASSVSSTPASSAGKAKKPTGKGAQGNIMSFFAKKS